MDREDREYARALKNARRRTRFKWVEEAIPMYPKPCGCTGGDEDGRLNHYIPNGVMAYSYGWPWPEMDLAECRLCGAVWTQYDLHHGEGI